MESYQRRFDPTESRRREEIWSRFINETYPIVRRYSFKNIPAESDRFVVIVEPRRHPHLEYVLRNVMHFLGDEWGLQIIVGQENGDFVESIVDGWNYVHVARLDKNNLSETAYNALKKQQFLWDGLKGEKILWIESDCLLCHGNIGPFLEYDYIGAPWPVSMAPSRGVRVGNGGLSLRSRAVMIEIARTCNPAANLFWHEDTFFSLNLHLSRSKYRLPTWETAEQFAVEALYYPTPFGLHQPYAYLNESQLQSLLSTIHYD